MPSKSKGLEGGGEMQTSLGVVEGKGGTMCYRGVEGVVAEWEGDDTRQEGLNEKAQSFWRVRLRV